MGLLSILNPKNFYKSASLLAKDASNLSFYRKSATKLSEQKFLEQYGMRIDWLKRMYYVINLEPETLLANDSVELEKSRVFESVNRIQTIFADSNLIEIINVSSKRIKTADYYAYVIWIKFKPISKWSDGWQVIGTIFAYLTILKTGFYSYHHADAFINSLKSLLNWINN